MRTDAINRIKNGTDLPVIVAPMFLINGPEMVINACASGTIGTFPVLNARTAMILEEWMKKITLELGRLEAENPHKKIAPWGVNFIVHRSNSRYVEDLELIKKYEPPVVITSLGDPSPVVKVVREYGGVVFADVINVKFAKKAIEKGVDGLVLVASGAGGHAGTYNPIAFMHEIRTFFEGPIALAGGMSKGKDILVAEILGADFAYIGTRFIPSKESLAQEAYKEMLIESSIEDIIYTAAFSGIHANYLIPSIERAGLDPNQLKNKEEIDFSEMRGTEEVSAWKNIWGAGQGIAPINKVQKVSEIIEELKRDYNEAIRKVSKKNFKILQS